MMDGNIVRNPEDFGAGVTGESFGLSAFDKFKYPAVHAPARFISAPSSQASSPA